MHAANAGNNRLTLRHALAGLQAGTFGTALLLAWLMLASVLNNRSLWSVPNLFATTFYGPDAYRDRLLHATWPGLALIVLIYVSLGVLWGIASGDRRQPLALLYGGILGMLVYYAFFDLIWKQVNPLLVLYAPTRQLQTAHVLWGMSLARSGRYARALAAATLNTPPHAPTELSSGEVIL